MRLVFSIRFFRLALRCLSKSFIRDPLFLSSKNGHKNHLRNFWSEKCPFFAFCGKVWLSDGYKNWARIFVWFLKIRATFPRFFASKTWKFLWGISEFLWGILKLLWVIRKFLYRIFAESKSLRKFLKSAFYFAKNHVSKLFTFSSRFFTLSAQSRDSNESMRGDISHVPPIRVDKKNQMGSASRVRARVCFINNVSFSLS